MRTVSVGEIRQNPTPTFDAIERGETVVVTRHNRPIAQIGPVEVATAEQVTGPELMAWLESEPFERFDTTSWQKELADSRADESQAPEDPWTP